MSHPLPKFGFDTFDDLDNWALIVSGRFLDEPPTQDHVYRMETFVREWAEKTGLPLAYVHLGTTINWAEFDDHDEDYEYAPALIGLVQAFTAGASPITIERAKIEADEFAKIPAEFWRAFATEFELAPRDEALYLAASGWTVAGLYAADAKPDPSGDYFQDYAKPLITACTDGTGCKVLDLEALPQTFWLHATYA